MVTALFVRRDSVYKSMGIDCYDIDRDARTWCGGTPVIAHPPCRAWGRLRQFAKPREGEKELAIMSVDLVRKYGGVLEHPAHSSLWKYLSLPRPGVVDQYGGFTLFVNQSWFGHKAEKETFLYIVGCKKTEIPPYSPDFVIPQYVIRPGKNGCGAKVLTKSEREHTPEKFAVFLFDLAMRCVSPTMRGVAPS